MSNDYICEIDLTQPTTRLVTAKTRNGALQHVAQGIISVRLATSADVYEAAKKGIERENASEKPEAA